LDQKNGGINVKQTLYPGSDYPDIRGSSSPGRLEHDHLEWLPPSPSVLPDGGLCTLLTKFACGEFPYIKIFKHEDRQKNVRKM